MFKNICKILFRPLRQSEFTEIKISHSGNTLEISEEDTNAGMLYVYHLQAQLQQKAIHRIDKLQFDVYFSDGTHILIGHNDYPAYLKTSQNLDGAQITVDWKDTKPPKFLNV